MSKPQAYINMILNEKARDRQIHKLECHLYKINMRWLRFGNRLDSERHTHMYAQTHKSLRVSG